MATVLNVPPFAGIPVIPGRLLKVLPSDTSLHFFGFQFYDYYGFFWQALSTNGHISIWFRRLSQEKIGSVRPMNPSSH
jgi:hypothetical protein